ncbi:MAG: hypothetical protein HYT90_05320 [Candidatus Omnitrophica bacterium]|nr:hypothetical protein [Candidatus Omnitrophota bacterium]
MEATRQLRQDHDLLRKKLILLESALQVAPEARFVLREMCFSLQRLLHDHIVRETPVLERCAQRDRIADHQDTRSLVRTVNELLLSGMRASMPTVVLWLSKLIELLREQMAQQERAMVDALEQAASAPPVEVPTDISGGMSVNEILQRYPKTQRLFEHLHINRLQEGYESVDEVAWHHGMDVSQFLEQLRQAATSFAS